MSYQIKTTPIEMLPDLDDLESNQGQISGMHHSQPNMQHINKKFIRTNSSIHQDSGMNMQHQNSGMNIQHDLQNNIPQKIPNQHIHQQNQDDYQIPYKEQDNKPITYNMPNDTPSCLSVAEHIANCPLCSKFYNNDKTPYIIAIVVLLIVCILLIKKILGC
jgi:hypothetical protein